jgi:transcriptional regulator with XRE-family HTH domain
MSRRTGSPDDVIAVNGSALREARRRRHLNQQQLADAVDVNKSTICRLEAEQIKIGKKTAEELVRVVGLSWDQLVKDAAEAIKRTVSETPGERFVSLDPAGKDYSSQITQYNASFDRVYKRLEELERKDAEIKRERKALLRELEELRQVASNHPSVRRTSSRRYVIGGDVQAVAAVGNIVTSDIETVQRRSR